MDCRGGDPEVVAVGTGMERMTGLAAREPQLGDGREQPIAHGDNGRCLDRLLKTLAPGHTPFSDEGVAELGHRDGCQEDLIPSHE